VQSGATSTYTIAVEPGVALDSFAGPIHWMLGEPDQARRRSAAAIARAEALEHPFSSALALVWTAVLSQLIGDVDRTREMGAIAKAITGEKGFVYWEALANCWFGWALAMQGEIEAGITELSKGLDVKAAMGIRQCRSWCLCLLAQAERRGGRLERARALVDEGLEVIAAIGEHFYEAELHRCKGEFLLDSSPSEAGAAEAYFQRAIEIAQGQAARSWELRAATSLARLGRGQGERQKAQDLLAPILASFTEGFDTPDLKKARALLEALR
jgi:predicted ATPase